MKLTCMSRSGKHFEYSRLKFRVSRQVGTFFLQPHPKMIIINVLYNLYN